MSSPMTNTAIERHLADFDTWLSARIKERGNHVWVLRHELYSAFMAGALSERTEYRDCNVSEQGRPACGLSP